MNKFFSLILMVGLLISSLTNEKIKQLFHRQELQPRKYFEMLSLKFYGTPIYADELAVINQKHKITLFTNENELIIPTFTAIKRLYQHYDVAQAQDILQQFRPATVTTTSSVKLITSTIINPLLIVVVIISLLIGYVMGWITGKRRRYLQLFKDKKELETVQNRDEFIINFKNS